MVAPGASVDIPVLKAYAAWVVYSGDLGEMNFGSATPRPFLLWQDEPGLITSVGLLSDAGEDSHLVVATAPGKSGNAVIGVQIAGETRWSWHVWVTPYNPNAEAYGKVYRSDNNGDGVIDYTWMDRNLGALSDGTKFTEADSLAACGLLYQWGRKDPFPGDSKFRHTNANDYNYFDSKPIYDAAGTLLTEGSKNGGTGIRTIEIDVTADANAPSGLSLAIRDPMAVYYTNGLYNEWFVSSPRQLGCDTLWCGTCGKTPFDPCPAGWRVPITKNDLSPWKNFTNAATEYSSLGVLPLAGTRYVFAGGCLKNSGWQIHLWLGDKFATGHGPGVGMTRLNKGGIEIREKDSAMRCNAGSVRCIKE
jgi:hypothetical protein